MSYSALRAAGLPLLTVSALVAATADDAHHDHHHHHDHSQHGHDHTEAHDDHGSSHAAPAPVGVMGDHVHHADDWMFSYRFMRMTMKDMRDGTDRVTSDDILMPSGSYMMAPQDMTMDMHMFGIMYAPSDRVTLMTMIPYLRNRMTMHRRMPMMAIDETFETRSKGLGDVSLTALVSVAQPAEQQSLHVGLGISAPTGDIERTDATPMGAETPLPYAMQLGTGTWDLLPSITWTGHHDQWSWGTQAGGRVHLGTNDHDYTWGDSARVSVWGGYQPWAIAAFNARMNYHYWGDIDGADDQLAVNAPMMNPNADPDLRGGTRFELGLGINLIGTTDSALPGHELGVEVLVPVHEDLDGPQMSLQSTVIVGWSYGF